MMSEPSFAECGDLSPTGQLRCHRPAGHSYAHKAFIGGRPPQGTVIGWVHPEEAEALDRPR